MSVSSLLSVSQMLLLSLATRPLENNVLRSLRDLSWPQGAACMRKSLLFLPPLPSLVLGTELKHVPAG